jgi:hypothetical protein
MLLRTLSLCLALLCAFPSIAQETAESPDFDNDQQAITFGGLVETQFNTTSVAGERATELSLRRVRLGANARVNDFVSGRIQAEFANAAAGGSAELNEAYALFTFAPSFQFLAGKGGRPFGIVDATTAAALVPIERGARIRGARTLGQYRVLEELAYAGRSVGAQILGEVEGLPFGLAYAGGYFRGALGEEGADADIHQLAARVQVSPLPWLKVAGAVTSRVFAREDPVGADTGTDPFPDATGADIGDETQRGGGYAVDFEIGDFGQPGFIVLGEFAAGTVNPYAGHDFKSAQGWVAYRVGGLGNATNDYLLAVEPLVRASWSEVEGPLGRFDGVLFTPGLNFYAAQKTRLALNLDLFFPEDGGDTVSSFKAQVQIAF